MMCVSYFLADPKLGTTEEIRNGSQPHAEAGDTPERGAPGRIGEAG
jgi:hypothetical protein